MKKECTVRIRMEDNRPDPQSKIILEGSEIVVENIIYNLKKIYGSELTVKGE